MELRELRGLRPLYSRASRQCGASPCAWFCAAHIAHKHHGRTIPLPLSRGEVSWLENIPTARTASTPQGSLHRVRVLDPDATATQETPQPPEVLEYWHPGHSLPSLSIRIPVLTSVILSTPSANADDLVNPSVASNDNHKGDSNSYV